MLCAKDIAEPLRDLRGNGRGPGNSAPLDRRGPPIARECEGKKIRYSAEAASLQAWRLERSL